MKLPEALKFSNERIACRLTDDGQQIFASDYGIVLSTGANFGLADVVKPWHDISPAMRKMLVTSKDWDPVDPKSPLVILAEAVDDWRDCDNSETDHEGEVIL